MKNFIQKHYGEKPDIQKWYQKIGVFILFFLIIQQIFPVIFIESYHSKNLAIQIACNLLMIALCIWTLTKLYQYHSNRISLKDNEHIIKRILSGIGIMFLLLIADNIIFSRLTNINQTSENQQEIQSFFTHPAGIIFIGVLTIIIAPRIEEFAFRYLIIGPNPKSKKQTWIRYILSTLAFGLIHMSGQIGELVNHQINPIIFMYLSSQYLILGGVLGFVYIKYHNYNLNTMIHSTWNLMTFIAGLIMITK